MKKAELIMNFGYIVAMLICAYWIGKFFGNVQGQQQGFINGVDTIYERLYQDTKNDLDRLKLDYSACICPAGGLNAGEVAE